MKKKIIRLLLACAIISLIPACGKFPAGTPDARQISLLPGECLKSNAINVHLYESYAQVFDVPYLIIDSCFNAFNIKEPPSIAISFDMKMDIEREVLSYLNESGKVSEYRYKPSNNVFEAFGDNSKTVKKEYDLYYESFKNAPSRLSHDAVLTTVYSSGDIILKANAPICGIPAGENLSSIAYIFDNPSAYQVTLPGIIIPSEYKPLGNCFGIRIPLGDYHLVDENVTFTLEVPVRVFLLLDYLKEKTINPEAEIQYRDDVLSCTFTINKGLR